MFSIQFKWVLLNADLHKLQKFYFGINSNLFVVEQYGSSYKINSIYKMSPGYKEFVINRIYSWDNNSGLHKLEYFNTYTNRSNLLGTKVNITHVAMFPETRNHLFDKK